MPAAAAENPSTSFASVTTTGTGADVEVDFDGVEREDPGSDEITTPFDPTKIRIRPHNPTISLLLTRIKEGEINLQPDFQRQAGLWTPKQQSQLIESILIRIPLPAFYFDATDEDCWLVVDGLQRLWTLKRFAVTRDLKLTGLEFLHDWNEKGFDDLPRKYQRRIEETQITAHLIEPGTPEAVKFNIFKRINTTSLPLSSQEIRHALNPGKARDLLKELAESKEFLDATAGGISDRRMVDRECVLRFLAFATSPYGEYAEGDVDAYLNEKMAELNAMDSHCRKTLGIRFRRAMIAAKGIFEDDAFRKRYTSGAPRKPINKALFETWSVNLDACTQEEITLLMLKQDQVKDQFMQLLNEDRAFETAISLGTGDPAKVRKRFSAIEQLIRRVLE
jgi:Protein of unknown function DUF262